MLGLRTFASSVRTTPAGISASGSARVRARGVASALVLALLFVAWAGAPAAGEPEADPVDPPKPPSEEDDGDDDKPDPDGDSGDDGEVGGGGDGGIEAHVGDSTHSVPVIGVRIVPDDSDAVVTARAWQFQPDSPPSAVVVYQVVALPRTFDGYQATLHVEFRSERGVWWTRETDVGTPAHGRHTIEVPLPTAGTYWVWVVLSPRAIVDGEGRSGRSSGDADDGPVDGDERAPPEPALDLAGAARAESQRHRIVARAEAAVMATALPGHGNTCTVTTVEYADLSVTTRRIELEYTVELRLHEDLPDDIAIASESRRSWSAGGGGEDPLLRSLPFNGSDVLAGTAIAAVDGAGEWGVATAGDDADAGRSTDDADAGRSTENADAGRSAENADAGRSAENAADARAADAGGGAPHAPHLVAARYDTRHRMLELTYRVDASFPVAASDPWLIATERLTLRAAPGAVLPPDVAEWAAEVVVTLASLAEAPTGRVIFRGIGRDGRPAPIETAMTFETSTQREVIR